MKSTILIIGLLALTACASNSVSIAYHTPSIANPKGEYKKIEVKPFRCGVDSIQGLTHRLENELQTLGYTVIRSPSDSDKLLSYATGSNSLSNKVKSDIEISGRCVTQAGLNQQRTAVANTYVSFSAIETSTGVLVHSDTVSTNGNTYTDSIPSAVEVSESFAAKQVAAFFAPSPRVYETEIDDIFNKDEQKNLQLAYASKNTQKIKSDMQSMISATTTTTEIKTSARFNYAVALLVEGRFNDALVELKNAPTSKSTALIQMIESSHEYKKSR